MLTESYAHLAHFRPLASGPRPGFNKLVPTLADAIERSRVVAAVQEARRAGRTPPCTDDGVCRNYECYPPERQCGKILIIEKEIVPDRMTVILVGEPLGF